MVVSGAYNGMHVNGNDPDSPCLRRRAPKFPTPVELQCLFALHSSGMLDAASSKTCLDMALHTLTMMGQGGIHDHVGGGFARVTDFILSYLLLLWPDLVPVFRGRAMACAPVRIG